MLAAAAGFVVVAADASASSVTSASFTGGAGTVTVSGTLYAKQGAALTLNVVASSDTECIAVSGAFSDTKTSNSPKSSWTLSTVAPAGDGSQGVTVAASPGWNDNDGHPNCTGKSGSTTASYMLDNTGPTVTGVVSPAPNAAGWNSSDVTVNWTATDTGVGVAGSQPFRTDSVTAEGIATKTAPAQSDRLGNVGQAGSVTVRVDKTPPTITASQTKNSDGTTTITFTCADSVSGVSACTADGSSTNSKTVQPGVTVTGTAIDAAGNTATASSTAPAADTTPPNLSGTPTAPPNGTNGWYTSNVTIHWTCSDNAGGSGLATGACPADDTISGEGQNLTVTRTLSDIAGNTTSSTSSPPVKIDKTAPTTGISGTTNDWVNSAVSLTLLPDDNLSGVASTTYAVDGGAPQTGTSFSLSTDGDHTITFFSTDKAGNVETAQTAHVRIDETAPTITHTFTPLSYTDGAWTNQDVTVTFACADQGGSGVAGCTSPVTKTADGQYTVTGTATDGAGNSATDIASVNIDKTAPSITAAADRQPNAAGWYNNDVHVSFSCADALSGIASCSAAATLGEGADQSAAGTATDAAGNSAGDSVSGINIDETDPVLSATFAGGWHTGDVTVNWSCTDALSGVDTGPADDTVTGEGGNLSSTGTCTDKAGNTATKTVDGIEIDRHAPTTSASLPDLPASGWYAAPVEVTLTGRDDLSGVATSYYTLDGGAPHTYDFPFTVSADGLHTVTYWSVDVAGNVEQAGAPLSFRIDTTAPTTTVIHPISPDSGWFVTSGISFAFDAGDNASGVAATYYAIDGGDPQTYGGLFTADLSDGAHTVSYWSVDVAGNEEHHHSFELQLDTVPPTITGDTVNADGSHRDPNGYGWFNSPVDVKFTCTDAGSGVQTGVAGCAGDTTLSNDGADQSTPGDAIDVAGNTSHIDFGPVNIDQTKPTLVGIADDANAAGWYNGDVTVKWVGHDALSGIDPTSQPANSTVVGEGRNLGAGPVTISDQADNVSDPASVSGIKIDRHGPDITGAPTTQPNAAGWYNHDVTVDFSCSDPKLADGSDGSGVASCPTSRLIHGNGADQSATSDAATDVAGNSTPGITVGGINIDGTAPSTTADNQCVKVNDWCTGPTANVVLTATDQAGLSGVKEIHYSIDGGADQVVPSNTATVSIPLSGTGAGTVTYWAVDNAGNVEPQNQVSLKWDNIAPTVTHTLSPPANASGWNNSNVTVTFAAKDDDNGSGVDPSTLTAPITVSSETDGQVVTGSAKDTAGNLGTDSVTVKLDKTAPTITAAITSGTMGSNGWYTGPVTVHFTCADALSGIPATACPSDVTLPDNGAGQSVTRTVYDAAGNSASATVSGINIDHEPPTVTQVNVQGQTYTAGAVPAATCTATDSYSGVASCTVSVTGGNANGVGTFGYTAIATDKAGNVSTVTGTYQVIYRFDGFLQPINDTAHQVGTSTSIFKAGSTVPVKFQLKKADGTVVQAASAPAWLTPVKGSATSAPVDESVYAASGDSGSDYKYDTTARQYIYNWKTGSGGNYWRIGVTLDDGQTYYVNIGLR